MKKKTEKPPAEIAPPPLNLSKAALDAIAEVSSRKVKLTGTGRGVQNRKAIIEKLNEAGMDAPVLALARVTGLSPDTVYRWLRCDPKLKTSTAARIRRAAAELLQQAKLETF